MSRYGGVTVSTRDAAVAKNFYGGAETEIEDRLAELETLFANSLDAIEGGADPMDHQELMRELVWTLSIRTRALREHFQGTVGALFQEMGDKKHSDAAQEALRRDLSNNFDSHCEEFLADQPPELAQLVRELLRTPQGRERLKQQAAGQIASIDVPGLIQHQFSTFPMGQRLSKVSRDGQLKGLSKLLSADTSAPSSFKPSSWGLIRITDDAAILGDACVVAVSDNGVPGTLLKFAESWRSLYLPVSDRSIIYAQREKGAETWEAPAINDASANLASSFFYSSTERPDEPRLRELIGSQESLLSDEEVERLIGEAWGSLARDREGF